MKLIMTLIVFQCTSMTENTFTSCPSGLDRPSSKLSMSICLLPHDWLHNNLGSSGS